MMYARSDDEARKALRRIAAARGETLAGLSRFIGRGDWYLQQYVSRGVPAKLPTDARDLLARYLRVEPWELGGR